MKPKKWIKIWIIIIIFFLTLIPATNFIINPYDIYETHAFNFPKTSAYQKLREIEPIRIAQVKPSSIILGTSRPKHGLDANHKYFKKPSYNLAIPSGTIYENKRLLKLSIEQENLKYALLGLDYIMFSTKDKKGSEIENNNNLMKYIFSIDALKDSLKTILGIGESTILANGNAISLAKVKDYKETFKSVEKNSYKKNSKNYTYTNTGKNSFLDFEELLEIAYNNNIDMDIIFNPSHIRLWESLDYFIGLDTWYKWKKDIVLTVEKVAKKYNKKPFRVVDFAVYHEITNEKIPTDNAKMKYYFESSHYTPELGNIVLDRLMGKSEYKDFGVEITSKNIDAHIEKQKSLRSKFINTQEYRREVFGD